MYLEPKRIEYLVTYLCNGKCRHCYAAKYTPGQPKHVDISHAVEIVRKLGQEYNVESVMTFGGEPMLFPDLVYAIHSEARQQNIPTRELITNGYWSSSLKETGNMADRLADSGVNEIIFSVDGFHQEQLPLAHVKETIRLCVDAGIRDICLSPCWLVSKQDDNEYNERTRDVLAELEDLSLRTSSGNLVEPEGNALKYLGEYFPQKTQLPIGTCGDLPYTDPLDEITAISVEPDGRVSICDELYIYDPAEDDILKEIKTYDPYMRPDTRAILEGGLTGLAEWAKTMGVLPDSEGYYSICQMCIDLRKRVNMKLLNP